MKTNTLLLIGGAAVLGYLYATRKSAATTAATQGLAAQTQRAATPSVIVNIEDDDYGPGWSWGAPSWGARSWGGYRGGRHHHGGGGHGGHRHGGRR